jgi:hypothetical protein
MRRRRDRNHATQKNNLIQDLVGNEENGYPVPDLNKIMINVSKVHSDSSKWIKDLNIRPET